MSGGGASGGALPERFNPAALDMLRRVGNGSVLVRMIDLFLLTIPERLSAARTGLGTGDAHAVAFAAHSIKSSAGQLGGVALQRCAAAVEHSAATGALAVLPQEVDAMHAEFELMQEWLTEVRAGTTATTSGAGGPS